MQRLVSISKLTNLAANGSNGFFGQTISNIFFIVVSTMVRNTDVQKRSSHGWFSRPKLQHKISSDWYSFDSFVDDETYSIYNRLSNFFVISRSLFQKVTFYWTVCFFFFFIRSLQHSRAHII